MFYLQLSRKMFYLQLSPMLNISNVLFAVISVGFGSSLFLLPQFNHFNPLFAATWKNKGKVFSNFRYIDLICAEETKKFVGIKKGGFCVDIEPNIRYSRNQGYLHQSAKGDISPFHQNSLWGGKRHEIGCPSLPGGDLAAAQELQCPPSFTAPEGGWGGLGQIYSTQNWAGTNIYSTQNYILKTPNFPHKTLTWKQRIASMDNRKWISS